MYLFGGNAFGLDEVFFYLEKVDFFGEGVSVWRKCSFGLEEVYFFGGAWHSWGSVC